MVEGVVYKVLGAHPSERCIVGPVSGTNIKPALVQRSNNRIIGRRLPSSGIVPSVYFKTFLCPKETRLW